MKKSGNGAKRGRGRPPKAQTERKRLAADKRRMSALVLLLQMPLEERAMVIGAVQALAK